MTDPFKLVSALQNLLCRKAANYCGSHKRVVADARSDYHAALPTV
jgi:hypothetical protein